MKKLFLTILFLLITVNCYATDYTADANCQGAWLFTEGSGETVADGSQNSNTGTFKGAGEPAWDATVPDTFVDYSVLFDAADDHVAITADSTIDNLYGSGGSAVAWIYPETEGESVSRVLCKRYNAGWYVGITDVGGKAKIIFKINRTTTDGQWSVDTTYDYNAWHHIAVTYDDSNDANDPLFYVDGVSMAITEESTPSDAATDDSSWDFYIGNASEASDRTFDGYITEVGLFDDILNVTEINDIKDNGLAGAAVVAAERRIIMVN